MRADIRAELRAFREQTAAANDAGEKHQPVQIHGDGHTIIFVNTVCAETMHFTTPRAAECTGSGVAEVNTA